MAQKDHLDQKVQADLTVDPDHEDHWDHRDDQVHLEPEDHEEIMALLDHLDLEVLTPKDQIQKENWLVSSMDHLA